MKNLTAILLFLALLVNVVLSADHSPSASEGSILLCKKTNLYFDSLHKDISKIILAYHTNHTINKDLDDNIEITVDINGDVYIRLGLHNYSNNKDYLKAKEKGDMPKQFFKGNQVWRQRIFASHNTFRLNPHNPSYFFTTSVYDNEEYFYMDYLGNNIPSCYTHNELSNIIISKINRDFKDYDGNIKYFSFAYEEIHLTNPPSRVK